MKTEWTANNIPSQAGRRVVITGANSGIGFEAALQLALRGAEIILPARSQSKADDAAARISRAVPSAQITTAILDLSSLTSVRTFAAWFTAHAPGQSIDLLINNAGVMAIPQRELTEDGYERQFATNFLGPFALTALLYPHIRQQLGSRIVTVSSSVTKMAKIDFNNLQSEHRYKPMDQAYAQSKLADSIFALELQRRLTASGSKVSATAAHPGYAITNLQTSGPGENGGELLFRIITSLLKPIASQDAAHGALPTLYAATAPEAQPGGYYGPDRMFEMKGHPTAVPIPKAAKNTAVATRLWSEAEKLTHVPFAI